MDKGRILVVDDDERVLFVMHRALLAFQDNYEIVSTQDGREALNKATEAHFDLIITDLKMPGMDGIALTQAIVSLNCSTVVVWITAALVAWLLPQLPHDQTVVFELGVGAASVSQLDVHWQAEDGDDEGNVTLNFPAPTPGRVVRQLRMKDGRYAFRITAKHRDAIRNRTEVVRRVTLDGNSLTLNLDELSP